MGETAGIFLADESVGQFDGTLVNGTSSFTASPTAMLHGTNGFLASISSGGGYCAAYKSITPATELYTRCYFEMPSLPSMPAYVNSWIMGLWDGTNLLTDHEIASINIRNIQSSTHVPDTLFSAGINVGDNQSFAWTASTVYRVEMHWKKDASAGVFEAWVDGTRIINKTGLDTSAYSASVVALGVCNGVDGINYYFDDFKVEATGPIGEYSAGASPVSSNPAGLYLFSPPYGPGRGF